MTVVNVVNVQKILVALTLNAGQYRHRVYSMLAKAEDSFRSTLNFFFFFGGASQSYRIKYVFKAKYTLLDHNFLDFFVF